MASAEITDIETTYALFTEREREVLDCLARGWGNKEIARFLTISEQTVKEHVHNVLVKGDFSGRTAIAVWWALFPVQRYLALAPVDFDDISLRAMRTSVTLVARRLATPVVAAST